MSLSPGVEVREEDRTLQINNIVTNATGFVGMFRWGPVEEVTTITTNESELLQKLGRPDTNTTLYFHSALNYLLYTNPLLIVRVTGDLARNAIPEIQDVDAPLIKNEQAYESFNFETDNIPFVARFPGELGNSIAIYAADDVGFSTWEYNSGFQYEPSPGEFAMVVVDRDGFITGNAGTVLERYELLSKDSGAKRPDGTSAYIRKVLQDQSNWVLAGDLDAIVFNAGKYEVELQGGVDDNVVANADFEAGWDVFLNAETVDVVRVFTSGNNAAGIARAIDNMNTRQDAVAFAAPQLQDVHNAVDPHINVANFFNSTVNKATSYEFYVDNWKLVYDKYMDRNIWIPCDSDAAALHARTFAQNEPWFSPAGLNRGQLKNVIRLAWNANKAQRDYLYKRSVNSIVSFPGEGTVLFGDKTGLARPSAFDRINVRTLFIVLKKNIARAARYQLFEINDFITRGIFRNTVGQYLTNVQARRGLYDFRVVCDESNNTPQVIDANEFAGDIYVKPARTISNIKLTFIAVATNVQFEEVEG